MDYRNEPLHVGGLAYQKGMIFPTITPSQSFKIWSFEIKVGAQNWCTYPTDVKFISDVTSINSTQSTPSFHQS